jgi:hypothetical protein
MDPLRRLLSAGGWLANLANQRNSRYGNASNDEAVRPLSMFFYSALGIGMALAFIASVTYASSRTVTPGSSQQWQWFGLAGLLLAVVVLMNAGWYVGLVPFVALTAGQDALAASPPAGIDIDVGVTGVVENDLGDRRRYRDRSARLTGSTLDVHPWNAGRGFKGEAPVRPDLGIHKAVLFRVRRPAVRFIWKYGPVILTFRSTAERDLAFGYLGAAWLRSGT